jgi:hypothetical protein
MDIGFHGTERTIRFARDRTSRDQASRSR